MVTSIRSQVDIHMDECLASKRVVQDGEVDFLGKVIGKFWRDVGEKLNIDPNYMDFLNSTKDSLWTPQFRVIFFWTQCYDKKATIGRLAKALCKVGGENRLKKLKP